MKNRGLSIVFAVAAIAVVAAFPAPAFAQLAPAYTNNFEQASDIQGWDNYSYPYDVVWAVDDTPIGGHNSSNSLNFNNGTDYDGDYPYGDIYNYSSPIDTSGMTDPVVSFWCYYDLTSDPAPRITGCSGCGSRITAPFITGNCPATAAATGATPPKRAPGWAP